MSGEDAERVTLDLERLRETMGRTAGYIADGHIYDMADYYRWLGDVARSKGGDHVDQWAHEMEMMYLDTANVATLSNDELAERIKRVELMVGNTAAYGLDVLEARITELENEVERREAAIVNRLEEYVESPEFMLKARVEGLSAAMQGIADTQAAATELGFAGLTDTLSGALEVNWEEVMSETMKMAEQIREEKVKALAEKFRAG